MSGIHDSIDRSAYPWVSPRPGAARRRRARLTLLAWWNAPELDRHLAAGARPQTSAAMALRAQTITGSRSRKRLAAGLTGALRTADDAGPRISAAVRPDRREVLATRTVLCAIERRLRAPEPVAAHGMAMLQVLLTDGTGPLYRPTEPGILGSHLRAAAVALEPVHTWD